MSIFNESYITEFFGRKKKEKKEPPKKAESYSGKYTRIDVSASDKSIFNRLYKNEALTAEGVNINDGNLEVINKWYRTNSMCSASNVNIYIIKGKVMNSFYHLTGDNAYSDDLTIVCIDWIESKAKDPYKSSWRWFSDVVDNNAKREIAKGNHHYDHYHSIYYGDIGIKD